jgi:hypothetical protein
MNPKQPKKFTYEIASVELIAVAAKAAEYAARLDRVAEALYSFITSSESLKKSVDHDGPHSSSIHLHEQPSAGSHASGEKDVSDGKDEPKTAA